MTDLIKQLNDLSDLLTRHKAELDHALKGLDKWLAAQEADEPDDETIKELNAVDEFVDELDDLSNTIGDITDDIESFIDELKGD